MGSERAEGGLASDRRHASGGTPAAGEEGGSRVRKRPDQPFVLVVAADLGPEGDRALDEAARLASRIPGCHLHVIHAVEQGAGEARFAQVASELEAYSSELSDALDLRLDNVTVHVWSGEPAQQIASLAGQLEADIVVIGARRSGRLEHLFRGSVADVVLRSVACPVIVAHAPTRHRFQRVAREPRIEPLCEDCKTVRALGTGTQRWCARHAEHHVRGHAYSYRRELPFAQHDSAVVPTGVPASAGRGP